MVNNSSENSAKSDENIFVRPTEDIKWAFVVQEQHKEGQSKLGEGNHLHVAIWMNKMYLSFYFFLVLKYYAI